MAVVATYKLGQCTAYVDDSCIVKTKEEVQEILDGLYKIYEQSELLKARELQKKEKTS